MNKEQQRPEPQTRNTEDEGKMPVRSDTEVTQQEEITEETVEQQALLVPDIRLVSMEREYRRLMMMYEGGIKKVVTKFEILKDEFAAMGARNPIEGIQSRLKAPRSIYQKLARKGLPATIASIRENLHDVAGVRVICPYVSDIYALRDALLCHRDVTLLEEKDYIKSPKPNGYRSLHLVIQTDLYLANGEYPVTVEVQLRTIAMNFWASLEHEIRYKSPSEIPEDIQTDLYECAEIITMTDNRMERIRQQVEKL